jgi:two-component system phosphate regulon sensor histidine kinase PhoR
MPTSIDDSSYEALNIDLENYFSNTIIPQLFVDANLVLRKFTPPAMKQFTLKPSDIGKTIEELNDNIRFPGIVNNITQVITSGKILEKEIQTTDLRWYQMNILPYSVGSTGKTNGVILTFVDITVRINDLKGLEKLIADQQILLDTILHDIKTPLTNILLAIDMIRSESYNEETASAGLEIIERATKKIQSMADDLKQLPPEASIQTADAELLSFENIVEDACMALTKQLQDANVTIKKDIQVSQFKFSRRKLRSVVYNLLSNAIKYRSPYRACEIAITTYNTDDAVAIEVKDNGIGIEKDKHEAIFGKYYRVQNTVEGTGVGLYLVREIIHTAGGEIYVESEPGLGSVFTVHLKKPAYT